MSRKPKNMKWIASGAVSIVGMKPLASVRLGVSERGAVFVAVQRELPITQAIIRGVMDPWAWLICPAGSLTVLR